MSLPAITTPSAALATTAATTAAPIESKITATVPRLLKTAEVLQPRRGDTHKFTVIWMHGLGDSSDGFKGLFVDLQPKDTKVILPNAPVRAVTINGGARMQAWYDIISTKRTADLNYPEDDAGIAEATSMVTELIDYEAKLVGGTDRILIGGFSQGAAMSIHAGLRYNHKLAGIISCSGYLMLPKTYPAAITGANKDTPILAYHGAADAMVAVDRAQTSYTILKNAGVLVDVTIEKGLTHSLSQPELNAIVAYFKRQLVIKPAATAAAVTDTTKEL